MLNISKELADKIQKFNPHAVSAKEDLKKIFQELYVFLYGSTSILLDDWQTVRFARSIGAYVRKNSSYYVSIRYVKSALYHDITTRSQDRRHLKKLKTNAKNINLRDLFVQNGLIP